MGFPELVGDSILRVPFIILVSRSQSFSCGTDSCISQTRSLINRNNAGYKPLAFLAAISRNDPLNMARKAVFSFSVLRHPRVNKGFVGVYKCVVCFSIGLWGARAS